MVFHNLLYVPLTPLCPAISIYLPPSLLILKYSLYDSFPLSMSGRKDDHDHKVLCENVESWNLLSSIAEWVSVRKHFSFFTWQRNLFLYGIIYVWFGICTQNAHIVVRFIFTDTAINFNFENTVFLFLFQLQWKRRGRRKVNQSFPLTETSFRLWLLWKMFLSFSDTIAMIQSIVMIHSTSCTTMSQLYLLLLW